jgi:pilus assembly protein CpaD
MSRSLILVGLSAVFCAGQAVAANSDRPAKGLASVNVPIVTRANYAIDLFAPEGSLSPSEAVRLDGWFRSMDLGYGDTIYVDSATGEGSRGDVARVAGRYGLLVALGAPMTAGPVPQNMIRIIVSRTKAVVPNCPNWSKAPTPNYDDTSTSNFGCAVNSNLAAMIADPQDLVYGREGSGVTDATTSTKAVDQYRKAALTGAGGLAAASSKGN